MENQNKSTSDITKTSGTTEIKLDTLHTLIVQRIRDDSKYRARLTSMESISNIAAEEGQARTFLSVLPANAQYKDIKLVVSVNKDVYLYSEEFLSRTDVEKLAYIEEINSRIVGRVREDSSRKIQLTKVNELGTFIPGAEIDKIDGNLKLMLEDERYIDIRLVSNNEGKRYLYSGNFLTDNYADILAQADTKDPYKIIAATVRNESRIYPRPTNILTFDAMVFNVHPEDAIRFTNDAAKLPEFEDIKVLRASNGAIYLYSNRFLDAEWVKTTVEWEEVGQYENP